MLAGSSGPRGPEGQLQASGVATVYLEAIERHAKAASRAHESNELDAAVEHTRAIAELAGEWGGFLAHMKSGGGPPAGPRPPVVLDGSGAPPPGSTVDPTGSASAPAAGGPGRDPAAELRIQRLELKLDQILQALGRRPSADEPSVGPPTAPGPDATLPLTRDITPH